MRANFSVAAMLGVALLAGGCGQLPSTLSPDAAMDAPPEMGQDAAPSDASALAGGKHYYAVSRLLLPTSNTTYAYDLVGSGRPVNQLGQIVQAMQSVTSQGVDLQAGVDDDFAGGSVGILLGFYVGDPTLPSDIGVTVYRAAPFATCAVDAGVGICPDFSGHGTFAVDVEATPVVGWTTFVGGLVAGAFSSNAPATARTNTENMPVSVTLELPLFGGAPIALQLDGAHLGFTSSASHGLLEITGQIQGSIRTRDVQSKILPAMVAFLNAQIARDPSSSAARQIEAIFDTGCADDGGNTLLSDGGVPEAALKDGVIQLCEVQTNDAIERVLSPDIEVFDAVGNYAPNPEPQPDQKDSLSVGLQFVAVPCTVVDP